MGNAGCGIGRDCLDREIQLFDDAGNVAIGIDGLRFEYLGEDTQRAVLADLDDWLYEFQWQPKELAAANSSVLASQASWLIFADGGGVGDALSALLEARGERSILVTAGETYEQTDDRHYRVRPERPEDISRSSRRPWDSANQAVVALSISGVLMLLARKRRPQPR